MKRNKARVAAAVLLAGALWGSGAAVGITIDGAPVEFGDQPPFVDENNRTLAPLRAVAEAMGIAVRWDDATRTAEFYREWTEEQSPWKWDADGDGTKESHALARRVVFSADDGWYQMEHTDYTFDGQGILGSVVKEAHNLMETKPIIQEGRLYAPIRYLAPEFFFDVDWVGDTQTVRLTGAVPSQFKLYDAMDGQGLHIVLAGVENMASAQVVNLTIASRKKLDIPEPDPGAPDYDARWKEYEALWDPRSAAVAFTVDTREQLDAFGRPDALTGIQAPFAFEPGRVYTIIGNFAYTTEQHTQRVGSFTISYTVEG